MLTLFWTSVDVDQIVSGLEEQARNELPRATGMVVTVVGQPTALSFWHVVAAEFREQFTSKRKPLGAIDLEVAGPRPTRVTAVLMRVLGRGCAVGPVRYVTRLRYMLPAAVTLEHGILRSEDARLFQDLVDHQAEWDEGAQDFLRREGTNLGPDYRVDPILALQPAREGAVLGIWAAAKSAEQLLSAGRTLDLEGLLSLASTFDGLLADCGYAPSSPDPTVPNRDAFKIAGLDIPWIE